MPRIIHITQVAVRNSWYGEGPREHTTRRPRTRGNAHNKESVFGCLDCLSSNLWQLPISPVCPAKCTPGWLSNYLLGGREWIPVVAPESKTLNPM